MKIVYIIVTSLDGRTLQKGGGPENQHEWASKEDSEFFVKTRDKATLIIMGSKTYEGAKSQMSHQKGRLRIVMTRNTEKYKNETIEGQLEFTDEPVKKLVSRLEKKGYKEALLVGGAHVSTDFFKEKLISELWQTLEPKILGMGNGIIGEETINVDLKLLSSEKLNDKGTLLLKYKVVV